MATKKQRQIVADVVLRWRETIMRTGKCDPDGAKALIQKLYKDTKVFVVDTPAQFYIGQAVIRKRVTKQFAKDCLCPALKIAPDFIDDLRGSGGPIQLISGRHWQRRSSKTLADRATYGFIEAMTTEKVSVPTKAAEARRLINGPWGRRTNEDVNLRNLMGYQMCDVTNLYYEFVRDRPKPVGEDPAITGASRPLSASSIAGYTGFTQRSIECSCISLAAAVSHEAGDILNGIYDVRRHAFDATFSELMCRFTNCKLPEITFFHEIFHLVPAVMRMRGAWLILSGKPEITLNAETQLHSEMGPAVRYADGTGFWFIDGHVLRDKPEQIVLAPETLTKKDIEEISNEEERRVAIERMGWEKYLTAIEARVIDKRENWVDNTVEVLFDTPPRKGLHGFSQEEPLRALLACRSTGRRYFIAAPRTTEPRTWRRLEGTPIKTCADVQNWMANGATTKFLPYATQPVRIVGAS